MKKVMILLGLILLFPLISAEITINQQPVEVYSLGDIVSVPVTVKTTTNTSGFFNMDIVCNSSQINFYKNPFYISAGEEKTLESSLLLTENIIGKLKGTCRIKASLGSDSALTNFFKVSDLIIINSIFDKFEFSPGETVLISGEATKENGRAASGFIELSVIENDFAVLSQTQDISKGIFSMNVSFPQYMKAGTYLLKLNAYEKGAQGEITNQGFLNKNIRIIQVPTSLGMVFETQDVEPGTNLRVKTVLYDQTGEKIFTSSSLTIKNKNNQIMNQTDVATDEFVEFQIAKNEYPSIWRITAASEKLTAESSFTILEKEDVQIEIANKTLTITNTGNIPYNKTATVKIGGTTLNIDVYLEVGESQKYILTAPNGEYNVEVTAGNESISEQAALTGKAIDVKMTSEKRGSIVKNPPVWIFVILILGFVTFIVFKKGYQKAFIGYISSGIPKAKVDDKFVPLEKGAVVGSSNKAELALSLKGDKHDVSVVAVNIKNLTEIQSKKSNAEETIQKIISTAEEHKAVTYESRNVLFFIISPLKTKTFKNEKTALNIALKIKDILAHHNRMFKQRIVFGISLNHGTIVARRDKDSFKFMSLGNLMASAKKISSLANEEILLGEKMNDLLRSHVKTIKNTKDNLNVYSIKDVKMESGEHQRFIRGFLERNKGEK